MARRPLLPRLFGVVRAMVFLSFAFGVVGLLALSSVRADAGEASLVLGREMSRLGDLLASAHELSLNGERVFVASATSPAAPSVVLDRVERLCNDATGGLREELADPEKLGRTLPPGTELRGLPIGVLRKESAREGVVACLAREGSGGVKDLAARFADFAESHDLGKLGDLRYAYARPIEGGRSHVVTVWTDGPVRLDRLFPTSGDAPGEDPPGLPRPPGLARMLSARVSGAPYGAWIYEGAGAVAATLAFYDDAMQKAGWVSSKLVAAERPTARAFSRGGLDAIVLVDDEDGGRVAVSMVVMEAKAPSTAP
jgi:hypothetical protein